MILIFLNPGHSLGGNPDPGCVNPRCRLRECDLAITYGSLCGKYLEAAGCEVSLLQSHNLAGESPEYPCVVAAANAWEADVFVSIHVNAGGGRGGGNLLLLATRRRRAAGRLHPKAAH
ncbi:N-acetylmuramoyl-L-alanine amidase [Selenomonas ruminantium]|uniref:N-acetylmuramoyl-L-alanine amidase n=1 Tax=Selenomonas ruminantium TaxID=971 RepID=A0A1I3ER74_SELRU|nr:N-acetylmuramoyl-L-alanine amidase [Selenomonas ruminantium]SFI01476.1 N-acetylmuramoyl-L-alanine amidase [Selenomonas ruminantium]